MTPNPDQPSPTTSKSDLEDVIEAFALLSKLEDFNRVAAKVFAIPSFSNLIFPGEAHFGHQGEARLRVGPGAGASQLEGNPPWWIHGLSHGYCHGPGTGCHGERRRNGVGRAGCQVGRVRGEDNPVAATFFRPRSARRWRLRRRFSSVAGASPSPTASFDERATGSYVPRLVSGASPCPPFLLFRASIQ